MKERKTSLYGHVPACPGVYLMKNKDGTTIYIGKSNNLKARVKSYFMASATLNFAKKKMVKVVEKIDFIETKSDIEALMLETNLIKKNQPKYNVLMKDGKNLSYIKITDDEIPCLIRTRLKAPLSRGRSGKFTPSNKGGKLSGGVARSAGGFIGRGQYFGPYSQYFDTRSYIRFIRKLFRLGNHEKIEKFGPPCMDTYIGLCPGHCTGNATKIRVYRERLTQARDFLLGKQEKVMEELRGKMKEAAQERNYEEAAEYKNIITQIESAGNTQIVRDAIEGDATIIVTLLKYNQVFLCIVEVKNSMIVGVHEYKLRNPLEETPETLVSQAMIQYLSDEDVRVLYTDVNIAKMTDIREYASSKKIKIRQPSRGEKVRILEFAHTNLLNFAYQEEMSGLKNTTLSKKTMLELLGKLGFETKTLEKKKEIIFECFDISHSHGEHTVASKSVLVNGKPDPKRYRKYRIKTLETGKIDDFASMDEILTRRTLGALRGEDPWPDLIIIDGGKGQLSHALQAISGVVERWNSGIADTTAIQLSRHSTIPPVISLAKRIEEVFLPKSSVPILLEKGSPELMILQKIRDEAHRFAINYNRSSREKSYTKTLLDEIPGIGPVARRKILRAVSRIEELSSWSFEKTQKTFGKKTAEALQNHGLTSE